MVQHVTDWVEPFLIVSPQIPPSPPPLSLMRTTDLSFNYDKLLTIIFQQPTQSTP